MRKSPITADLVGSLGIVPAAALADPVGPAQAAKPASSKAAASSSRVDANTLVITRTGRKASEMTLTLTPSTNPRVR